ncbi:hypothetical protein [Streptomyces sp. NPDC006552]|uniref:hypothetical protein n=1 Tax=Streptomyces sp. NPDC006552 TaxID=3157179 RepID=UPI0033A6B10D
MRIRTTTATATGAVVLALAASVAWSAPALAAGPGPAAPGTVLLSNEAYDSLHRVDEDERELILTDPSYREAWIFCLRSAEPSHVERNAWGAGYVCIPDGAVQ